MKRNRPFSLEIQNTKWENPIYEMTQFYTSPENIQNTKWKNPIYEMSSFLTTLSKPIHIANYLLIVSNKEIIIVTTHGPFPLIFNVTLYTR